MSDNALYTLYIESNLSELDFQNLMDEIDITDSFGYQIQLADESLVKKLKAYGIIKPGKKGYVKAENFQKLYDQLQGAKNDR